MIGGYDFVGSNYDVVDAGANEDPTNDIPRPDADPLDGADDDHGSHTSGTIAGIGVPGEIGKGVAPAAKLLAIKVWDEGNSTDDVLVAGYERAMDPNNDGNLNDAADVLSFSGGVDYGTLNSVEARAAQRVVDLGTVFVASAGNSGNQPVGGSAYITGTPATARGVVSVAASIDQFNAQTITVNSPPIDLPDDGIMVQQDWGADLPAGGLTDDLFDGRELDPPDDPGNETPADAQFCDPLPGGLAQRRDGARVQGLDRRSGDCGGSEKVFHAQNAGANAVVMISLFGGAPSALASGGENDHDPGGDDHRQRRLRDPRRAQPRRPAGLQLRHRQRDPQRRDLGDPGVHGRDDRLHVGGPGAGHQRPEAGHHRARVRHPVDRRRHR